MVAAGDAVDVIEESLRRIVAAYGVAGLQIALLPTSLFVQTGRGDSAHVQFSSRVAPPLRLDQIDELYRLVRRLERGELTVSTGLDRLQGVYDRQPAFGWPLRTAGHAVLAAGLVLLIEPTPGGFIAALGLGLLIGVLKLVRLSTATFLLPVTASFLVAAVVFASAAELHIHSPIRLLVAPLVTFLPGGMLAIATMEIAAGQMVAGASRLVNGLVQLGLLAFGIVAAGALVGAPTADFADHGAALAGTWEGLSGVIVFALGIWFHFSAPLRSVPWILLVVCAAFAGQAIGNALFGAAISGFFGAAAMTPVVLWVERLPSGPPKLVTFLPAFWLLVPGATGLIGLTQIVGSGPGGTSRGLAEVYYGIKLLSPGWYYAAATLICGIVSMVIGSSWTTAGTLGVGLVEIASAIGVSPAITAGAVVGGAYLGDKLSPLSETTVLTAQMVGVRVDEHIKRQVWTSVPAFLIGFVVLLIMGLVRRAQAHAPVATDIELSKLSGIYHISLWNLLPLLLLGVLSFRKVPATLALIASTLFAGLLGAFLQPHVYGDFIGRGTGAPLGSLKAVWLAMANGFRISSGIGEIDRLLSRGAQGEPGGRQAHGGADRGVGQPEDGLLPGVVRAQTGYDQHYRRRDGGGDRTVGPTD
jgi:uncharacterized membrane protein YjjP (DUF1212 family)/uncharacterized membrane protein YjjB (DUF3815 family)